MVRMENSASAGLPDAICFADRQVFFIEYKWKRLLFGDKQKKMFAMMHQKWVRLFIVLGKPGKKIEVYEIDSVENE